MTILDIATLHVQYFFFVPHQHATQLFCTSCLFLKLYSFPQKSQADPNLQLQIWAFSSLTRFAVTCQSDCCNTGNHFVNLPEVQCQTKHALSVRAVSSSWNWNVKSGKSVVLTHHLPKDLISHFKTSNEL